jgi:hypothetical protein
MKRLTKAILVAASAMLLPQLVLPQIALANKIGVAAATKNEVHGFIGAAPRALAAGSEVFTNELVRTGQAATAQLLFLDQTSLSIGPQSEIKLDRFVYNPERGTGALALSATKGAFRFISGSQNPTSYSIKTPVATIGVRGTICDLMLAGATHGAGHPQLALVGVEGTCVARLPNGQVVEVLPGKALIIFADGRTQVVTWDSTLTYVAGNIPFPLYGNSFWTDPRRHELNDKTIDLNDVLGGLNSRPPPPPPIDLGGSGSPTSPGGNFGLQARPTCGANCVN